VMTSDSRERIIARHMADGLKDARQAAIDAGADTASVASAFSQAEMQRQAARESFGRKDYTAAVESAKAAIALYQQARDQVLQRSSVSEASVTQPSEGASPSSPMKSLAGSTSEEINAAGASRQTVLAELDLIPNNWRDLELQAWIGDGFSD